MAPVSPLLALHQDAHADLTPYGPPLTGAPGAPEQTVLLATTFGLLELEYAALRKSVGLLDQPHRTQLEVTGPDALDFLNRMLTQELGKARPLNLLESRRSFWLNRKGRIDADLRVLRLPHALRLDLDIHAASRTLDSLNQYIITEDVMLRDLSAELHRLALHGPTGPRLLAALAPASAADLLALPPGRILPIQLDAHDVLVEREDSAGVIGLELTVPASAAAAIYQHLVAAGAAHDCDPGSTAAASALATEIRLRPIGWHAYNIARIESGTPLYNVDFGQDSLPAESGVLLDRVSFTKGCYLGQEIVARMHARGHPKQQLVCLHPRAGTPQPALATDAESTIIATRQPVTGTPLFRPASESTPLRPVPAGDPVGAVSSSTLSPMLSSTVICFAQIKHEFTAPGTVLVAPSDAGSVELEVQPALASWPRPS